MRTLFIIYYIFIFSNIASAECQENHQPFVDDSGQVICLKASDKQALLEEKCINDPDFCLIASQNTASIEKKEQLLKSYKTGLEISCNKKKLASYCAKLAGLLENKHAYKDILSLNPKEVMERQELWAKACKLGGDAAKDSFFCFQKKFLIRFKANLSKKCKFKLKGSCDRLSKFNESYKLPR